jgi:hypothetical protein
MPSQAYTRFVVEFLEANSWAQRKEGVPLELLDALDEDELAMAEEALIQRLSTGDDWPARGLGYLRSQNALTALRALLPRATGTVRAATGLAIWQISRDATMCGELIRLSHEEYTDDDKSWKTFTMIDVIHCLAHLPYPAAVARLEELKTSGNSLIAYNANYALGLRGTAYASDANSSSIEQ